MSSTQISQEQQLSHEEIWDDTELIKAWEMSVAEHKRYHGRAEEPGTKRSRVDYGDLESSESQAVNISVEECEMTEVTEEPCNEFDIEEIKENLLQAWYNAGYYTGLYEASRQKSSVISKAEIAVQTDD